MGGGFKVKLWLQYCPLPYLCIMHSSPKDRGHYIEVHTHAGISGGGRVYLDTPKLFLIMNALA